MKTPARAVYGARNGMPENNATVAFAKMTKTMKTKRKKTRRRKQQKSDWLTRNFGLIHDPKSGIWKKVANQI